uniref:Uncharacterized protein n=1 Tax=Anguilla anguilla TaxID=7936 RepID=A0A0E9R3C6_ANGAN
MLNCVNFNTLTVLAPGNKFSGLV